MYIEAMHDATGKISSCYCNNFYPSAQSGPVVTPKEGLAAGQEQSRIIIDTFISMEISTNSGQRAVIDPTTGQPKIDFISTGQYVMDTFVVDMSKELAPAVGSMKIRGLVRK